MTEENEVLQTEEIPDAPERPEGLGDDVLEYVEWLEARIDAKNQELENDGNCVRGVAFVDLFGVKNGKQVKVGISANSRVSTKYALMDIIEAVSYAKSVRLTPYIPDFNVQRRQAEQPADVQPPDDIDAEPAKKAAPKRQAKKEKPNVKESWEELDEDGLPYEGRGNVETIDYIKIIPQPDNRATIEFWRNRRKYPELYLTNWSHEDLAEKFPEGEFEIDDFSVAQVVQERYNVEWVYGAVTTKGKSRYRDVTSITPA